jgi:hypothetical protein
MAIAETFTAWVWQATASDGRLGFVGFTREEFDAAIAAGRAQDPMTAAELKPVTNELYRPAPVEDPPPRYRRHKATPAADA